MNLKKVPIALKKRLDYVPMMKRFLILLFLLLLGAAGVVFWMLSEKTSGPNLSENDLDNIPQDAVGLAKLDVASLKQSPSFSGFVTQEAIKSFFEEGNLNCGAELSQGLEKLFFYVRGESQLSSPSQLNLITDGSWEKETLLSCISEAMKSENLELTQKEEQGITYLSGNSIKEVEAMILPEGDIIFASKSNLENSIQLLEGKQPSLASMENEVSRLWNQVSPSTFLSIALMIPQSWKEQLKATMVKKMGSDNPSLKLMWPFIEDLQSIALGAQSSDGLSTKLVAHFTDQKDLEMLMLMLEKQLGKMKESLALKLTVLGDVVNNIKIESQRLDLLITLNLNHKQTTQVIQLIQSRNKNE
jgi:hypothetical protein